MFYSSISLRESTSYIVPRGPKFSRAESLITDIDGSLLSIRLPKHQKFRSSAVEVKPKKLVSSEKSAFSRLFNHEDEHLGRPDHWRAIEHCSRAWAFNGPCFTGYMGSVKFSMDIYKVVNYPENLSLFHPRAFEQVIADNLTYSYGNKLNKINGGIQEFNAPLNWKPLNQLPANAVYFDVVSQGFLPFPDQRLVFLALADKLMVCFSFTSNRRPRKTQKVTPGGIDDLTSEQPMLDLVDNIINSIELTLSPEAEAQQKAALAGMDDTSLVKDYPIIKWDKLSDEERANIVAQELERQNRA